MSVWRDRSKKIIHQVLAETAGKSEAEIKKALFDAYPFGPRQYHPYKIWLDEIRKQRGGATPARRLTGDGESNELWQS